jgi:hypothetical protein
VTRAPAKPLLSRRRSCCLWRSPTRGLILCRFLCVLGLTSLFHYWSGLSDQWHHRRRKDRSGSHRGQVALKDFDGWKPTLKSLPFLVRETLQSDFEKKLSAEIEGVPFEMRSHGRCSRWRGLFWERWRCLMGSSGSKAKKLVFSTTGIPVFNF